MKKRSISLLCAIAIVITMLSVGTVLALTPIVDTSDILTFDSNGGNSSDGLVGTGVAFNSNTPIVENDWTASGTVKLASDKTYIELATGDSDKLQTYTYNTKFNLTDGFTVTYNAGCKQYTANYSNKYVMGVKVGNMVVALKEYCTPTILIDDTVVASGDVIAKTTENYNSETGRIKWTQYASYLATTGANVVYKVVYEPATKTITYGGYIDGSPVATVATYTDTENKLNVEDASFALYTYDMWDQYNPYKNVELTGRAQDSGSGNGDGGDGTGSGDGSGSGSGDDEQNGPISVLNGTGFEFGGNKNFDISKWHADGDVAIPNDNDGNPITNKINIGTNDNVSGPVSLIYNDKFNLTGGFTFTYDALCKQHTDNYSDGYVMGAKIGNITIALKEYATPTILIDNEVVASGAVMGKTADNFNEETGRINWTQYVAYLYSSGKDIIFKAEYDADTKVLTFGGYINDTPVSDIAIYSDADNKINVEAAEVALYTNDRWDQIVTYSDVKLVGGKPNADSGSGEGDDGSGSGEGDGNGDGDDNNAPSLSEHIGLAVKFDKDNVIDENQWTSVGGTKVSGDKTTVQLASGDSASASTFTYNTYYNLTKGFVVSYNADCKRYTGNYSNGYVMGAKIGNVTVALKEYSVPVILVDGNEVARGDVIGKTAENYDDANGKIIWTQYKEYIHSSTGLSTDYKAVYDAETKTLTFGAYADGRPVAKIATFTDTNGIIDVSNAQFALYTTDCWDQYNNYSNVEFYGYVEPEPEPGEIIGKEINETWAPENLSEADWEGAVNHIVNGEFNAPADNSKYVIETKKNYNLSNGFAFKGTLVFKNGYTNYGGEYCSATFGDALNTLELRVRNDSHSGSKDDNSYTAYLVANGEEIASSDLMLLPNGEYELKYNNGKVIVSLGGTVLEWKLADGTDKVTAVNYDGSVLKNAKISLRLVNNWCPNGRKWSKISLSPISSSGVVTGDSRNLVLPIVILAVSVAAAGVLIVLKKKGTDK